MSDTEWKVGDECWMYGNTSFGCVGLWKLGIDAIDKGIVIAHGGHGEMVFKQDIFDKNAHRSRDEAWKSLVSEWTHQAAGLVVDCNSIMSALGITDA